MNIKLYFVFFCFFNISIKAIQFEESTRGVLAEYFRNPTQILKDQIQLDLERLLFSNYLEYLETNKMDYEDLYIKNAIIRSIEESGRSLFPDYQFDINEFLNTDSINSLIKKFDQINPEYNLEDEFGLLFAKLAVIDNVYQNPEFSAYDDYKIELMVNWLDDYYFQEFVKAKDEILGMPQEDVSEYRKNIIRELKDISKFV